MDEVIEMRINTKSIVSITEANQNFSKVARLVDEQGVAVILKNNKPRYIILDYMKITDSEQDIMIEQAAHRILKQNVQAFNELAK
jgi:antitoxin Phd